MPMMTAAQYEESLRRLNLVVYMFGKRVGNVVDDPIVRPSMLAVAHTYELAHRPEHEDIMTAVSHLTGARINRFTHIHRSTADLVKKSKMGRLLGRATGCCFQRCVGMDALNALSIVTYDMDRDNGSTYHRRFLKYLAYVQENDLTCDGAMTDPKGDRSLPPHRQPDPDAYVHIVRETPEGIVVRGAKAHQTGALNSHEIIVMPTIAMRPEDRDYAVSFALPSDAPGITYILGRQSCDTRKLEEGLLDRGNIRFGGHEALVVLEDVLVPWERVFMCGEYAYAGELVEKFAAYHRQSYACKVGVGDVLIGAAQTAAEYNNVAGASHVKDKLIEMNHLNETLYCGCIACASEGHREPSGTFAVDTLLANVHKQNVTRLPYEISRIAQDIAGGLMVTMPSEADLRSPDTAKWLEKYFTADSDVPAVNRMRILRLIENLTLGTAAVGYLTESMHGAGSPQAQRIMIARLVNMAEKKWAAKTFAASTRRDRPVLRAALKYCGGCNPGYDRVLLADTVREQFVGRVEFVAAGSCADVDLVLVLAGCDTACADLSAFEGCETVVISSTKDAERMIAAALQTMSSRSPDDDEGTLSRRGATKGEENGSS